MRVTIQLINEGNALSHDNISHTYVDGGFYCIVPKNCREVTKFPIERICRVTEFTADAKSEEESDAD